MSAQNDVSSADERHDIPRFEPWLGVSAAATLPVLGVFFLPDAFMVPLMILAAVTLGAGMVMMVRQGRGRR